MPTNEQKVSRTATVKWVPINLMRVSNMAQREKKQYRIDKIVAEFDPERLGLPTVNKRDGFYYIVDGQHRVDALRAMGMEDQQIQCSVYEGLSESEEAAMFLQLNDILVVGVMDKYRVGVVAGVKDAVSIDKIVRSLGLKISLDNTGGSIKAVGTLRKAHEKFGPDVLKRSLRLISDAYGDAGFQAAVIDGITQMIGRYGDKIDDTYFVERIGGYRGGVNGLLNNGEILRRQTGNSKGSSVAAAAVRIYNSGKHPGIRNLTDWFKSDDE